MFWDLEVIRRAERDEKWFLFDSRKAGDNYPIYRLAITYSLFRFLSKGHSYEEAEAALSRLQDAVSEDGDDLPQSPNDFIEIYHFQDDPGTDKAYVVVDQMNGCYPLIIYSKSIHGEGQARAYAYRKSAEAVFHFRIRLFELHKNHFSVTDWTKSLQDQLFDVFLENTGNGQFVYKEAA